MPAVVDLRWSADADQAVLGEPTGEAELAVQDTGAASALALVDAVLVAPPVAVGRCAAPGTARRLAVADRDRVLVQVHLDLYGPRITTTLACRGCAQRFDLDFRLDELAAHCDPGTAQPGAASAVGAARWRIGDVEFRPVTGDDELAALADHDPAEALLRRVTDENPASPPHRAVVGEALAVLTPSVCAPIDAPCPECGTRAPVEFDVQHYLLARILAERPRLWRSVYLLASSYHWSRSDILALCRSEREAYVAAITASTTRRVTR